MGNKMKRTGESPVIEKLAANVLETRFEDLCREDIEFARIRIIDTVGCLIGGAYDGGNRGIVDIVKDQGGKKESTILVYGGKVPAQNAAMVNNILCRSFDFEPVSPATPDITGAGHLSGSTVMTALALGESKNISGKELLTALLVGDDTATRIMVAGSGPMDVWPSHTGTGTINGFGSTAIAGRLLGLDEYQLRNAFGIILNEMGGSFQMIWDGATAFKLDQGTSARNGIFSAQLAKAGWTGAGDALFDRFGYYNVFTQGCRHPEVLTDELGKRYWSDYTIKPYPCCRMTHAAIDCALNIVNKHGIDARDIEDMLLYVSPVAINHICAAPFEAGDFPHGNAAFSFQYTVGTALLNGCVKPEHFTGEVIRDPGINAFIKRIKVEQQPEAGRAGAELRITMKDGRELVESVVIARGDQLNNPLSRDEIIDKFWMNVDYSQAVSGKAAGEFLALADKLEELDSVDRIIELLVA
jgi:2-methylcitrate dehydratase PrpD